MSASDSPNPEILKLSKLDVARRQLQTAITLWFTNGDPVSTHTLAFAAYEIIHTVTKMRNPNRQPLLFDHDSLTPKEQKTFRQMLKDMAGFFKHAERDSDKILHFSPEVTVMLIMNSITGIRTYDKIPSSIEAAFTMYLLVHNFSVLTDDDEQGFMINNLSIEILEKFTPLSKAEFFESCLAAISRPSFGHTMN